MSDGQIKMFTLKEIAEHSSKESVWLLINNGVYDVSKFLDEHPGGLEPLLEWGGKDATEAFEDIGHSADARDLMKNYKIGELSLEERKEKKQINEPSSSCSISSWIPFLICPVCAAVAGFLAYKFYSHINK